TRRARFQPFRELFSRVGERPDRIAGFEIRYTLCRVIDHRLVRLRKYDPSAVLDRDTFEFAHLRSVVISAIKILSLVIDGIRTADAGLRLQIGPHFAVLYPVLNAGDGALHRVTAERYRFGNVEYHESLNSRAFVYVGRM